MCTELLAHPLREAFVNHSMLFFSNNSFFLSIIVKVIFIGDIIEPRLTEQWFMDTAELYAKAAQALKNGEVSFVIVIFVVARNLIFFSGSRSR